MDTDTDNYESHLVGLFMRLWGYAERPDSAQATILANAQNPFDHWFGDICGEIRYRYFLIEFKATRDGFLEEVKTGSKKPHRAALYRRLCDDSDCRTIARVGHFAAYEAEKNKLAFEPYAHSIAPRLGRDKIVAKVLDSSEPWFEPDYQAWTFGFKKFYDALHETDLSLHRANRPWLFNKGLGIPEADLEQYVSCMYAHLEYHETDKGRILLGAFDPSTKEFKAVSLPPFQMVKALKERFDAMRVAMEAELKDLEHNNGPFRSGP